MNVSNNGEENEYGIFLVKYVQTKLNPGNLFKWPERENRCVIKENWIVGGLLHPQLLRRGQMKFDIDISEGS